MSIERYRPSGLGHRELAHQKYLESLLSNPTTRRRLLQMSPEQLSRVYQGDLSELLFEEPLSLPEVPQNQQEPFQNIYIVGSNNQVNTGSQSWRADSRQWKSELQAYHQLPKVDKASLGPQIVVAFFFCWVLTLLGVTLSD